MDLPYFRYHPNPISTGAIRASREVCECCNQARGFIYTSIIYAEEEIEFICPWCIADGSAAEKFNGSFSDDFPLRQAGISNEVISEVCERTPSYNSWQQEKWQSHCGDACEFHGNVDKDELSKLSGMALECFLKKQMIKTDDWNIMLEFYVKGGSPAIYKFKCRVCSEIIYMMDYD